MAKPLPYYPCPDCYGGDPPCCGCFNQEENRGEYLYKEEWNQNQVLKDELRACEYTIQGLKLTTDRINLLSEIERLDRVWEYEVNEFAKNVPCKIDRRELAEIANRPFSKEYGKQVHEIVKKHFPEVADIMKP